MSKAVVEVGLYLLIALLVFALSVGIVITYEPVLDIPPLSVEDIKPVSIIERCCGLEDVNCVVPVMVCWAEYERAKKEARR